MSEPLGVRLSRAAFVSLAAATTAAGAAAFWSQSGAFPAGHPALWACSLGPLFVAAVALVGVFAPWDEPRSAQRWAAPPAGVALGLAAGGLAQFPVVFLGLTPLLLAYAAVMLLIGRRVARAAGGGAPPSPGRARASLGAFLALGLLVGLALTIGWRAPPGGARPGALDAGVASIASPGALPGTRSPRIRPTGRIQRREAVLAVWGNQVGATLSLLRPRLELALRGRRLAIEPCLHIDEGTYDGGPWLPALNGYRAEPGGLARAWVEEGAHTAWLRAVYPTTRATPLGSFAPWLGPLGRAPAMDAELDVELDLEQGRVLIDARTRLPDGLTLRAGSLAFIQLEDAPPGAFVRAGVGQGVDLAPADGRPGTSGARVEVVVAEAAGIGRALRARRRDEGPFETIAAAHLDPWVSLEAGPSLRTLIYAPDWATQASLEPSRSAGHGLPENAILPWREGAALNVVLDVASSRLGPGILSTRLPPGIYRDRLVVVPLNPTESASTRATAERLTLEQAAGR